MINAPRSPISHAEAETLAEKLALHWEAIVGGKCPPTLALADLVQHVLRGAAEIVAERPE